MEKYIDLNCTTPEANANALACHATRYNATKPHLSACNCDHPDKTCTPAISNLTGPLDRLIRLQQGTRKKQIEVRCTYNHNSIILTRPIFSKRAPAIVVVRFASSACNNCIPQSTLHLLHGHPHGQHRTPLSHDHRISPRKGNAEGSNPHVEPEKQTRLVEENATKNQETLPYRRTPHSTTPSPASVVFLSGTCKQSWH
jgi:hypothetical protein